MLQEYKPGTTQWGFCGHLFKTPVLCEGQCNPALWYPQPARLRLHIKEIQKVTMVQVRLNMYIGENMNIQQHMKACSTACVPVKDVVVLDMKWETL